MNLQTKKGGGFSATFLVAGKCIGVGTLAIPITTGIAGFYPAIISTFLVWLFSLATGLLFIEVILATPDGSNVISITKRFLGRYGMIISGASFLFMYYLTLSIYFSLGVPIFTSLFNQLSGIELPFWAGQWFFLLFFGGIVYLGVYLTDKFTLGFMLGIIAAITLLVIYSYPHIITDNLKRHNWIYASFAIPILFSGISYQTLLPTLCTYLNRNPRTLRLAVIFGTALPMVIYCLWQWVIIGTFSEGQFWLAYESGFATLRTSELVQIKPWFHLVGDFFTLFAFFTSLLATGIAMVDFCGDGIKISLEKRIGWKRLILCLLVFLPPFLIAQANWDFSSHFFTFIDGFMHTIFIGFLPIWLVWLVRYHHYLPVPHFLPGGKPLLIALLIVAFYIIYFHGVELIHR